MSASKTKHNYFIARIFHWVAGFLIIFNLLSGWKVGDFPLAQKQILIMIHSGLGTTILILMLFRWWWRRTHRLYTPTRWWKKPSRLLQWIFYPLLLIQAIVGVVQAGFIDYEVLAFGFINYSAIAADSESLYNLFHQLHGQIAMLLIVLVLVHGLERSRGLFVDDGHQMKQ